MPIEVVSMQLILSAVICGRSLQTAGLHVGCSMLSRAAVEARADSKFKNLKKGRH